MRTRRRLRPAFDRLDDRCLPSGLTPAQLTAAYGLDAITFTSASGATVKGDGTGSTIALIEAYHDATLASDLDTFDQAYNLPDPPLDLVNLGGGQSNPAWSLEESLDVEWAHAIAPARRSWWWRRARRACRALQTAINIARNIPAVNVISMSLGFPESSYHGSLPLTTPAGHTGITFVAASGDSGLAGGSDWPAVSPDVLAVGGTTLYTGPSGQYFTEVAWSGSGGGESHFVSEPSYQRGVQTSGQRITPDVAFDGDPDTGVEVYQTSPYTGVGSWQIVGGTSLGTPAWAAIIAIADQGRLLARQGEPRRRLADPADALCPPRERLPRRRLLSRGPRGDDGPRLAHRPRPDRRPGGQQHLGPADHLERTARRPHPPSGGPGPGGPPTWHHRTARTGHRDRPGHEPSATRRPRPAAPPSRSLTSGGGSSQYAEWRMLQPLATHPARNALPLVGGGPVRPD